jgi:hypothetical protein
MYVPENAVFTFHYIASYNFSTWVQNFITG